MPRAPIISQAFLDHACNSFLTEQQRESFITACSTPLRKSIRVNTLKISVSQFREQAAALGLTLTQIPWCQEGFWVSQLSDTQPQTNRLNNNSCQSSVSQAFVDAEQQKDQILLGNLVSHLQGLFYIQEASSMLPPQALFSGVPNDVPLKVLDLAAAPGSKTTQMAALMNNAGLLLANEISASRVKSLHANIVRCGVANTCLSQFDGRKLGQRLSNQFDLVLLDAPCGGEGTIRKDPKALQDWQLSKVREIAELQKQLIDTAYQCVRPGGKLVYSTCTLSPEENQQVAEHLTNHSLAEVVNLSDLFKGAEKATTREGYLHIQPQIFDSEGFFVSAFIKPKVDQPLESPMETSFNKAKRHTGKANTKAKAKSTTKWTNSFSPLDKKLKNRLVDYLQNHFGIEPTAINGEIQQKDKQVWLLPAGSNELNQSVRLNRSGIKMAEIYPNKVRTHHEFAIAFESCISQQKLEVETVQAEEFYRGKNIELTTNQIEHNERVAGKVKDGEVLLIYQGFALGLASLNKYKLKNLLPRDLVKDSIKLI